jgi:hypothetical protein
MKIRKLPFCFRSKGFEHELVKRVENTAIYRRARTGIEHFEVIQIRIGKLHIPP